MPTPTPATSTTLRQPFWRRHVVAVWAIPLGVLVLIWFFVIQPRTVTTVNEAFPTSVARPTATVATNAQGAQTAPLVATVPTAAVAPNAPVISTPVAQGAPTVAGAPAAQATTATGPTRIKGGMLAKVAEGGSGSVTLFTLTDGSTVARLENLQVPNGPDLRVVLRGPNGADLDLGALKGNSGNQSYTVPAGTNLAKYDTLAIYCRAAHVTFAQATLS